MPETTQSDPDARLAELRRQRDAVAGHLAWLDREIAAAGGNPQPQASGQVVPAQFAPATPGPATPAPATVRHLPSPAPAAGSPSRAPFSPDAVFSQESTGLSTRDKIGCFAIVAFIALLILSFFWVLPYLVHRDDAAEASGDNLPPDQTEPAQPRSP